MASSNMIADAAEQIRQQLYRYCRSMDRMDVDLGYSIWHEDAQVDYGEAIYRGSGKGFIDFVTEQHRQMEGTSHQVTNILLDLGGEDEARTESYVTAALRFRQDGQLKEMTTRGRYLDHWVRSQDRWVIIRRVYVHDLDDVREISSTRIPPTMRRDTDDPSYQLRRS